MLLHAMIRTMRAMNFLSSLYEFLEAFAKLLQFTTRCFAAEGSLFTPFPCRGQSASALVSHRRQYATFLVS